MGIPKDKQKNLFESFIQAKEDTARKFGGTGLGLAICKKITSLMGGSIKLESEEGLGADFSFYIPIEISKVTNLEDCKSSNKNELFS